MQDFSDKMRRVVPRFGDRVRKASRIDDVEGKVEGFRCRHAIKGKAWIPEPVTRGCRSGER